MIGKILFILLAAFFSWYLGAALIAGLIAAIPASGSLLTTLIPDITGRSFGEYLLWILGTLVFWVILKIFWAVLGGIFLPASQSFSTTKPMRRLQWGLYNLFLWFDIYLIVCAVVILLIITAPQRSLPVTDFLAPDMPAARRIVEMSVDQDAIRKNPFVSLVSLALNAPFRSAESNPVGYLLASGGNPENLPLTAFLIFIVAHSFIKRRLSRIYTPIIRILQIGRFGLGGSGRFAGQIEEWGLIWKSAGGLKPKIEAGVELAKIAWEDRQREKKGMNKRPEVTGSPEERLEAGIRFEKSMNRKPTPPSGSLIKNPYARPFSEEHDLRMKVLASISKEDEELPERQRRWDESARARELHRQDLIKQFTGSSSSPTLFMGRSLYSRFVHVGLAGEQHMLTVASSRSGKGVSCIIPNLLTFPGSVLCIDPKGTNAAVTAARRKAMGQNVYVIDPFEVVTKHLGMEKSDGFNPLSMLDPDSRTIREDVEMIADAMVVPSENVTNASHWDEKAKTIISGLIAHVITTYKNASLPMIRELKMQSPEKMDRLWAEMAVNRQAGDLARDAGMSVVQGAAGEEMQSILSNVDKNTDWLSGVAMKDVLNRSSFKFAELKERPTTIYLVLPMDYLSRHRRFLRLFINLALLQMPKGGRSPHPVLAILDEFLALGRMNEISRGFRELAGYNLILWPFVQDLSGLQALYQQDYNAFLANSRAVQMFAVNDQASLEYAAREVGDRNMSYIFGVNALRSTMLRTPKEISIETSRGGGAQYIFRTGEPPLLLERVKYYEDLGMVSQTDPPPSWLMLPIKKVYPFTGLYGKDPDYK